MILCSHHVNLELHAPRLPLFVIALRTFQFRILDSVMSGVLVVFNNYI